MTDTKLGASAVSMADLQLAALAYRKALETAEIATEKANALIKQYKDIADGTKKELARLMRLAEMENLTFSLPSDDPAEPAKNLLVEFVPQQAPKVLDWSEFHEWIIENERLDMLHKRVSSAPVVEIWQAAKDDWEMEPVGDDGVKVEFAAFVAKRLPPGVTVEEWKEIKLKVKEPKKARRARA